MEFEINKTKYKVFYEDCLILEGDQVAISFENKKDMIYFINKVSDFLEKEIANEEKKE